MKHLKIFLFLIALSQIVLIIGSCENVQSFEIKEQQEVKLNFEKEKYEVPGIDYIKDVPNLYLKALVGRALFFFKEDGVSCASCHDPKAGFTAGKQQSIGKPHDKPGIKSPSAIGLHHTQLALWNGAAGGTEANLVFSKDEGNTANNFYMIAGSIAQVLFAQNAHEQPFSRDSVMRSDLLEMFKKAYPNVSESRLCEPEDIAECIAAFEILHLNPDNSIQQQYIRGELDITDTEKIGWNVFDQKCEGCHKAPYMGADRFTKTTTKPFINEFHDGSNASNLGRYSYTRLPEDKGKFRVMNLQTNIVDHACWGFSCEEDSLHQFIYDHASVTQDEVLDLVAFLSICRDEDLILVGSEF